MPSSFNDEQLERFLAGDASEPQTVALREWRVEDFSSAYLTHRDHLVRYAKRFLPNGWEAEEVVQDAFLYLMTALPELDSEIGVLRFLKWKTKMLAIDLSKSRSKQSESNLAELPELESNQVDVAESIVQADDAAIVALALSKLPLRQRQALLLTFNEGRPSREVAEKLQLSENALRQLVFRARKGFKEALVGEASVNGKTASEIISLAFNKAAKGTAARTVAGLSIFLVLSVGLFNQLPFQSGIQEDMSFATSTGLTAEPRTRASSETAPTPENFSKAELDETLSGFPGQDASLVQIHETHDDSDRTSQVLGGSKGLDKVDENNVDQASTALASESALFGEAIISNFASSFDQLGGSEIQSRDSRNVVIESDSGLTAYLSLDLESDEPVGFLYFSLETEAYRLIAVPQKTMTVVELDTESQIYHHLSVAAVDFVIGDFAGTLGNESVDATEILRFGLTLDLVINASNEIYSADLNARSLTGSNS